MLKKIKNYKPIFAVLSFILLIVLFKPQYEYEPIEELAIPSILGYDLAFDNNDKPKYKVSYLIENYTDNGDVFPQIITGISNNIPEVRELRQYKANRKILPGLERFVVYSEDFARFGIESSLDTLFSFYTENDIPCIAIFNGSATDLFKYSIPGYPSLGDYLQGMVEHSKEFNFVPDNYKVIDAYVRVDAEGRNFVAPYMEIRNNVLQITGMGLFKRDKMVLKIDNADAKTMNLLRENNVRGILSLQKNSKDYISCYVTSKRKVKCEKLKDKYIFTINLSIKAEVTANTIGKEIFENKSDKTNFEKQLSSQLEKQCYDFINKMQKDIRVDCLELGWVAAAKYGRGTGTNWDEAVADSEIRVNAEIDVIGTGRGNY